MNFKSLPAIAAAGLLFACNSAPAPSSDNDNAPEAAGNQVVAVEQLAPSLSADNLARVCRAAVADQMVRSPSIVKVTSNEGGLVRLWYKRPDDGKRWTYDCKVEGDRVIWRTINAFGDNGAGRWRTTENDDDIRFTISGNKVTLRTVIAGEGGLGNSETYEVGS